jgi:hypothetical protein
LEETSLAFGGGLFFCDLVPSRVAASGWLLHRAHIQEVCTTALSVQIEKKHQLSAMVDLVVVPDAEDTVEQLIIWPARS